MTINKSANFKTFEEGIEFIRKITARKQIVRVNFSGVIDYVNINGNGFRVDWIDEEEISAE